MEVATMTPTPKRPRGRPRTPIERKGSPLSVKLPASEHDIACRLADHLRSNVNATIRRALRALAHAHGVISGSSENTTVHPAA
jgi:hypothetical protein